MRRVPLLLAAVALAALPGAAFAVDANTCGYNQGNGGWYKAADRSGPYALDGNCNATLIGASGAGGSGSTVAGSQEQDVRTSQPLAAATANATIAYAINGQATVGFTFTGLTASGATLTYEQSIDGGTTWTGINAINRGTGVPEATRTTDGQIALSATGRTGIRVRVSTTGTGTITVASNISVREGIVSLGSSLPPGNNSIGTVNVQGGNTTAVKTDGSGTTQPVSTTRATTFSEATNASVGASANLLGAARFVGSPAAFSRFNTAVTSTQAGTLFVQGSNDAAFTVPVTLASVAVTAGQFANASVPVVFPYNRAYLFNGSTAATATLSTSYTAN